MPKLSAITNSASEATSIKYNTLVYEMKAAGRAVNVMSLGEAFFDIPLLPFDDLPFPDIYHYSHSRGISELRGAIAKYFAREYDVQFDPATEIIVTAGSKAAVYMALLSVIDPGDEVIYSEPAWVSYSEQIKLCHGVPMGIPLDRDVHDYEHSITEKTKAIIITNPNNPRGYVFSEDELRHLLRIARKYDLWVFSDEAYSDFVLDGSFTSMAKLDPEKRHAVVFNSLSKNHGMSGWRLGYVVANPAFIFNVLKVNQHLITCPATILQHYVAEHFDEILAVTKPQITAVVARRELLKHYLGEIGLGCLQGAATFYFFVSIDPSQLDSESFCQRLLDSYGVCVVPGIGYGASCDRFVRVSVGTGSLEQCKRGLDSIRDLIDRTALPRQQRTVAAI